jgi:peptidoglycan-associated lipoprotein
MKKVVYLSAVLAALVFSGCSKTPQIDATANAAGNGSSNSAATAQTAQTDTSAVIAPITNASSVDTSNTGANASGNNGSTVNAGLVNILFDYDKFDVRADMLDAVKANASLLKGKTFKLEGNCDEFGSDEYNFALGLKRANAVKTALVNEGITADSISMVSLGEGNPTCTEKTQECWAKNRRVEVKLP